MDIESRIKAVSSLGTELRALSHAEISSVAEKTANQNPWFTEREIKFALQEIAESLTEEKITRWLAAYTFSTSRKVVALIAAGNIPLVAFHDFLSILLSGHQVLIKLSSKDTILLPYVADKLMAIDSRFRDLIRFTEEKITGFDAVIATGSDNTARYFEYYFGSYPHIIRKNRSSCAILTGFEAAESLTALGHDVFRYYGLGCRNVSKIFIPAGFDVTRVLDAWEPHKDVILHHKYANNYDYQKSIMLLNKVPFLDSGYVLITENEKLVSPIGVVHYEHYNHDAMLKEKLSKDKDKLQCVVGEHALSRIPFGKAQSPELDDYADQIDTLRFLSSL